VWNDFILLRYKDSWVKTRKFFKRSMEGEAEKVAKGRILKKHK